MPTWPSATRSTPASTGSTGLSQMTGLTARPAGLNPHLSTGSSSRNFLDTGYRLAEPKPRPVDDQGRQRAYINNLTGEVEDGCLLRVWGVRRDITQQKLAEQEVRQSEAKLRAIFGAMTDVILIINAERALPGNRAYQPGAPVPACLRDARERPSTSSSRPGWPITSCAAFARRWKPARCSTSSTACRSAVREMWFTARISPLSADTVIMVAHDITRRRATEAALEEANARLEATLKAIPDVMFEVDRETRVYNIYANERAPLDIPPDVFLGRRMGRGPARSSRQDDPGRARPGRRPKACLAGRSTSWTCRPAAAGLRYRSPPGRRSGSCGSPVHHYFPRYHRAPAARTRGGAVCRDEHRPAEGPDP